jgi:hypothetical protein
MVVVMMVMVVPMMMMVVAVTRVKAGFGSHIHPSDQQHRNEQERGELHTRKCEHFLAPVSRSCWYILL